MPNKLFHFVLLFILGCVLGLPWGIVEQREVVRKETILGMQGEEDMVDGFAKMQFIHADPQQARRALLDAVTVHEKMKVDDPDWDKRNQVKWGFCYGDLALLEESAGNPDLARNYMVKAKQILTPLGFRESKISEILQEHASARAQSGELRP
jgi:hypothetical protein